MAGKAVLYLCYGAFAVYICFVILPTILPNINMTTKLKISKPACAPAWKEEPNNSEKDPNSTEDRSSVCYVYPEDLMKMKPPTFLKSYKNPCWMETKTDQFHVPIRCLPYFFLIGCPKCGTTDLYTRIYKHPQISDKVKKEIHWFTRARYVGVKPFYQQLPKLENYTYELRLCSADVFFNSDKTGYHNKIIGDGSVSTLWDSTWATRFQEYTQHKQRMYTVAQNIHHLNPDTKFVSIIRDPVERLYSDYLYFAQGNVNTKEHFHDTVQRVIESSKDCLKNDTIEDCALSWGSVNDEVRILLGLYNIYFKEFYDVFPKKQILVIKLENFTTNICFYMKKVFKYFDLDPLSEEEMAPICDMSSAANTRRTEDVKLGGMLPETRKLLEDFYRPHNAKLAALLGEEFNYNNYYGT